MEGWSIFCPSGLLPGGAGIFSVQVVSLEGLVYIRSKWSPTWKGFMLSIAYVSYLHFSLLKGLSFEF
jgi:hypothetical protein